MYHKKTSEKKADHTKFAAPQFYVVQLGNHAKLRMLNVIELLRKEKIPVYHSLTKEKITGQLSSAEYLGVSHILIMGQKEALESTIVVRSVDTRERDGSYEGAGEAFEDSLERKKVSKVIRAFSHTTFPELPSNPLRGSRLSSAPTCQEGMP